GVGCCHSEVLSIDGWTPFEERIASKELFRGTFAENVGCCYSEFGTRQVIWLSRGCGHCGMVGQAEM
ncbi:hypothetical protein A2U01_0117008, partial [Trifolium medium]|nr:hypothetical protein [Trifolium medium]